jgi:hypothetical protein
MFKVLKPTIKLLLEVAVVVLAASTIIVLVGLNLLK